MPVNTEQWCASIGLFQSKPSLKTSSKFMVWRFANYKVITFLVLLLLSHGDIEVNQREKSQNFHVVTGM